MRKAIPKKKLEKALSGCKGIKTVWARQAGVSLQTIYNALKKYPELNEKLEEETYVVVELCKEKLVELIEQGSLNAITYYLEKIAKVVESDANRQNIVVIGKEEQAHLNLIYERIANENVQPKNVMPITPLKIAPQKEL